MASILLVEDDAGLADLTQRFLTSHGLEVTHQPRGDEAVQHILRARPDIVLLDLMLPGLDGTEVCRRVRAEGFAGGVIMLTARGEPIDEILGLQVGADDYLAKPVRPRVLLARVQAMLRRVLPESPTLDLGRLVIETRSRTARLDGTPLDLTTADYDMLALLASHAGTVMSRDTVSMALRGVEWDGLDRSIDLRISRLRKKLGDSEGRWIKSVRGAGYLLIPKL